MVCTRREIGDTLSALLGEMRAVLPKLRDDEREALRRIMSADSGSLSVREVFPDFARENLKTILPFLPDSAVDPDGQVRFLPHLHDADAFFIARLRRAPGDG